MGITACVCVVGCLPATRLNSGCRWVDDTTAFAAPGAGPRRAHLVEDVRVARDLGIRYADASAGRMNTPSWHDAQRGCTEQSFGRIMRAHHSTRAELATVDGNRDFWIDLLAVFLPAGVMFLAASHAVIARVVAGYDRGDRVIVAVMLAALAPLAAGAALALVQVWGVLVEQLRLRDDHISYRAFDLPASRHGWLLWSVAIALFSAVGIAELRRRGKFPTRQRHAIR